MHFYPGWYNEELDNASVFWVDPDADGISVLTDIDTDCYDYNASILLYVDVWYLVPEDTEGEEQYFWKDINMTVNGMDWDNHWLNFTYEELNETNGTWSMWVALLLWVEDEDGTATFNCDGDPDTDDCDGTWVFQQQFDIPMIRVEAPA